MQSNIERYERFKVAISQTAPMDMAFAQMTVSEYELLVMTIYKLNDLISVTNGYSQLIDDILDWILGEGLASSVNDKLNGWLLDGTLEELINEALFNSKLDKDVFEDFLIDNNVKIENNLVDIKSLEKRIEDYAIDITPYYDTTLDLSVAVKNCIIENYTGYEKDEGLHIFFPSRDYITHNSIHINKSCLMFTGGTRARVIYEHKEGVSLGGETAIFNVYNSVDGNLRRIIIRNFEITKTGTIGYKITGLAINSNSESGKALVDSEFDNLWITHVDVGIASYRSWCNNFNNIRVWSVSKPLYLVNQTNNYNFTRCSFVSFEEENDIINAEGISFIGCEFANLTSDDRFAIVMYQSSIILINPYIENIDSGQFVILQEASQRSAFTILGGQQTDATLDYVFDGQINNHIEISGMNRGTPNIKKMWSSSKSNDLRLNNRSFTSDEL